MHRTRARAKTYSSRFGMLGSLSVVLVVGLAVVMESQQLMRTAYRPDEGAAAVASRAALPTALARAAHNSDHADRLPAAQAAPVWKPGFEWHYRWSDPRGTGTYIRAITGEDVVDGVPAYIMQTESRKIFWDKTDLAWLMETVNGEVEGQAAPGYRKFMWPLDPRKTWEARYTWTHPTDGRTEERVRRHRVMGLEAVQVPAGNFQAFRVVVSDSTGKKLGEYWYAPDVRWLVKERSYLAKAVRERELIYLSLWPRLASN